MVSVVVKVFEAITNRVVAGSNRLNASSIATPSTLETIATSYRLSSRPSASTSRCGPSADPPMPVCRMCRTSPSAPPSIASISARMRAWSAPALATDSSAPSPRSAVCSAARSSVTLTWRPANIASRLPARSCALASASNALTASRVRCVFDQSKWMPATSRLNLPRRSLSSANNCSRCGGSSALIALQSGFGMAGLLRDRKRTVPQLGSGPLTGNGRVRPAGLSGRRRSGCAPTIASDAS